VWGAVLRFGTAAAILFGVVALRRLPLPRGRALVGSVAYGLLYFGVGFGLIHWALVDAPAGMTQVVLAVVPLLALLLAVVHRIERLRWRSLAGAVLAVVGVGLVFEERLTGTVPTAALLAILGGAIAIAEGTVVVKRFPGGHPVAGSAVGMAVGAALLAATSAGIGEPWTGPVSTGGWLWFGYLVLIGSVVVFVLYLRVVERWTASATSYVWPLLPLVAVPFSAAMTGEPISSQLVLGGAVVVLGVYLGAFAPRSQEAAHE
jgi:drug/metabolite transporter (DMT)-like permease